MSVLITGVGTILAVPVVRTLLAAGHTVHGSFRSRNSWLDQLAPSPHLTMSCVDLSVAGDVDELVATAHCRIVVHMAATSPRPGVDVADLIRDNVDATRNLAMAAAKAGVTRFIFMSSMSVYGRIGIEVVNADTPSIALEPYGLTKLLCEQLLQSLAGSMRVVCIRLPALLGGGARRHWLAQLVELAKGNREISIFNPDSAFNNGVYVWDVAKLIGAAVDQPCPEFSAFPIASSGVMKISDVVNMVVSGLGSTSPARVVERALSSFIIDFERAQQLFGYKPLDIQTALEKYLVEER